MFKGFITAVIPIIKAMLAIELPITSPKVIRLFCLMPDKIPITNSGALVPKATTENPTINDGMANILARFEAESINTSALFISNANPIISSM